MKGRSRARRVGGSRQRSGRKPYPPAILVGTPSFAAVQEYRREAELGRARVGTAPEDRLRWVAEFTRRNLDALRPEERVALGYDLRALIVRGWRYKLRVVGPLPEPELRAIQIELAAGLVLLLKGEPWFPRLPSPHLIRVREDDGSTYQTHLIFEGSEAQAIVGSVAELLVQTSDRLRECAKCKRPFVGREGKVYCSRACSQTVRDQRKRKKQQG